MLGWYLDEIVVYLFRTVVRLIKEHRSSAWPVTEGRVLKTYPPGPGFYPEAEVAYTYTVEGKLYTGMHTRAFWFRSSAKDYADEFDPPRSLVVRYRQPVTSVVRYRDQF